MLVSMKGLIKHLLTKISFFTYNIGFFGSIVFKMSRTWKSQRFYPACMITACHSFVEDADPKVRNELLAVVARISAVLSHSPQDNAKRARSQLHMKLRNFSNLWLNTS